MKNPKYQAIVGLSSLFMLAAWPLLAVDQFPACWRGQPGTTFQKWGFDVAPADLFPTPATPVIYPSPDAGSANVYGAPQAQVVVESGGVGWFTTDATVATTLAGIWDLGYGGGSVSLTIPNANSPSTSARYISVQVTEAFSPDIAMTNTVTVVGGTLIGGTRATVETNPNFTWVVSQTYWLVPATTASDTVLIAGGCPACNASGGGMNAFVESVVVETMTRSPAADDIATATPLSMVHIPVLVNDGGPSLTIAGVGAVTGVGGSAVINGTNIDYTAPAASGTASFTYTNMDCSNSISTATVTVTVGAGVQPPQITTCPASRTLPAGANCQAVVPDLTGEVVATGTGVTISQSPLAGSLVGLGSTVVTVTAANAGGMATCTATITVTDQTAPVLSLPANILVTLPPGVLNSNISFTATATDACTNNPTVNCTPASGSSFSTGVATVQCTANDGHGNTANGSFTVTVQAGSSYQDGDLLLVFRKDGASKDVLFNLGSVSNYLGLANGTTLPVSNFDVNLVKSVFGSDLTGVKYVLMAGTSVSDSVLRVWLSDGDTGGYASDETYSKWSGQRGKIAAVGTGFTTYAATVTNQSLLLPPTDAGAYTYIAGNGGTLDVTTLGGSVAFTVEQGVPARLRLFELKVSTSIPKPVSVQVGGFTVTAAGQMTFVAGMVGPAIVGQPSGQAAECGGSASFTVSATGDEPLSYQWFVGGGTPVGGNSSTLSLSSVSFANLGSYTVTVSNAGGAPTSTGAALTVTDTIPPVLGLPSNQSVTQTGPSGAAVTFNATATDTCAGSLPTVCVPTSGSTFPVGVTTVNCSANDGHNTANGSFTVTVVTPPAGFTYRDTDLLLVFRKDGHNDVLFNLGNVSNYLGLANGTILSVNNWDRNLVQANFGSNLTGVKYVLMAATPLTDPLLRVWISDGEPTGFASDESFSKWAGQRAKINAVGVAASTYASASNQSLVLPPSDQGSYTYIASGGGLVDLTTFGGSTSFPVEQDIPGRLRLFELKVNMAPQKPAATQVGGFTAAADGTLGFSAGMIAPSITASPVAQTAECGGSASFTVSTTGDEPLAYQWFFNGATPVGANSPTLTFDPVSIARAGSYLVIVNNNGGPATSSSAALTVVDTTKPVITCPPSVTVNCDGPAGRVVVFAVTAVDSCAGSVPVVCTPASGSSFPIGATMVTCVADDGNHNTNQCAFQVTVLEIAPQLTMALVGTNLVISWPQPWRTYALEQQHGLTQPPTSSWTPVGPAPVAIDGRLEATIPAPGVTTFYRLRAP